MTSYFQDDPDENESYELSIQGVALAPETENEYRLVLRTSRGDIAGQFTVCEGGTGAAVMVGGASGGLDGPAGSIYPRLAEALRTNQISTLRLHYRHPGEFEESVLDVLGWDVEGALPDAPKYVILAAPHTTSWDLPVTLGVAWVLGIDAN